MLATSSTDLPSRVSQSVSHPVSQSGETPCSSVTPSPCGAQSISRTLQVNARVCRVADISAYFTALRPEIAFYAPLSRQNDSFLCHFAVVAFPQCPPHAFLLSPALRYRSSFIICTFCSGFLPRSHFSRKAHEFFIMFFRLYSTLPLAPLPLSLLLSLHHSSLFPFVVSFLNY